MIRLYPRHWCAAAVVPPLSSGGGLTGQEALNDLLRTQLAVASPELASLARDLLGMVNPLRWTACGPFRYGVEPRRLKWQTLLPAAQPGQCDLAQLGVKPCSTYYAATVVHSTDQSVA
ncbi:hypothetical protein IV102_09935 [bacterium]|nr:hypothetical protein [bacterium]